jgi:microcystin-dependent protein
MSDREWRLYLRRNDLDLVGEFDQFAMDGVLRHNDISTATVTFPLTDEHGIPIALVEDIDWGFGLILERDGVVEFSGPITAITDSPDALTLELQDDTVNLRDRVAVPTPAGPPYPDEYDVRTGQASTIMRQLVDVNADGAAIAPRRFPGLTLATDPLLGTTITSRTRFNSLLEELRYLALVGGGLGFRVVQSEAVNGTLEFQIYQPTDRAATVVFDVASGTLANYSYTERASTVNYVYGLGSGLGAARPVYESSSPPEIVQYGRRIERVIDSRDSASASDVAQAMSETLAGGATHVELQLEAADNDILAFGRDYGLGDLVSVVTRRKGEVAGVVREVEFSIRHGEGISFKPTIGTPGATGDEMEQTSQQIAALGAQISNLERNWTIPPNSIDASMLMPVLRPIVGEVRMFGGGNPGPLTAQGWKLADGSAVSRATFAALFAIYGTTYGAGDGSTTFNLPAFSGRLPMGATGGRPTGTQAGAETFNNQHAHTGAAHDHDGDPHHHPHAHGPGSYGISVSTNTGNETGATGIHEGAGAVVNAPPSGHTHPVTVTGSATGSSALDSTGATFDAKTGPAQYGGNLTGNAGSTTQSVLNPVLTLNMMVYTGVAS